MSEEEKPFVSKEDFERLMAQGKKEKLELLFNLKMEEFSKTGKRNGTIKLLNEFAKAINPNVREEKINDDFFIIHYGKKGGESYREVNIDKVAEYIENKFEIRTIFGIREETIEVYNEGIWSVKGRGIIKGEVERLLGTYAKNNVVNEILEKIKRRTETKREDTDIYPEYKRAVSNGVLDLEDVNNIKFIPHSKEYNFRSKFPMDYNQEAKCPKIINFIEETFYSDDIPKLQEFVGLLLPKRYDYKKTAFFHGQKNTGKTIWLNLLTAFVGGNSSGLSLQEISKGKPFDLLVLKDKDANICDDLSSADMSSIGGFKQAVGDGWISGEMKFGDKLRFKNTAKHINACNIIPLPKEDIDDDAYYDRIILIPVDNVVPKEKINKNLINELTTPEELSGFLIWAIEGYKRLVLKNGFSNDKTPEETKFLMVQNGNSLAKFSAEVLIQENGSKVDKETMYQVYCKWCMNHKPQLSPDSKEKLGRTLTKFAPYTQASSSGKERYWLNVKITDTYYTIENTIRDITKCKNTIHNDIYNFSKSVISVSDKKEDLDQFSDEEIKQAGYDPEELKDFLSDEEIKSEEVKK